MKIFVEALRGSPSCIGDEGYRQWVERLRGRGLKGRQRVEDVTFRRVVEAVAPEVVLAEVGKVFQVEEKVFGQRRRNSGLRAVAARCLIRLQRKRHNERPRRFWDWGQVRR